MNRLIAVLAVLSQPALGVAAHNSQGLMTAYEQHARATMEQYFLHLTGPDVLQQFEGDYAAYVDFYGKVVDRNTLLREKARFIRRWPERSYHPRQNSFRQSCKEIDNVVVCTVTGLVDFRCRSPERGASSTGVTRFIASVGFLEDRPQIVAESSAVLE